MGTDAMLRSARLACCILCLLPLGIIGCDDEEKLALTAEVSVSGGGSGGSSGSSGQGGAGGVGGAGGKAGGTCAGEPSSADAAHKTPVGLGQPPPPTPGAPGPFEPSVNVQAIRVLRLGDATPDGTADPKAWRRYGFDLDGLSSGVAVCGHCKPEGGAKTAGISTDGEYGIDNSWGENIVPGFIATLAPNPTATHSVSIAKGVGTTVLRIHGLASGGDQAGLTTEVFTVTASVNSAGGFVAPHEEQWNDGSYLWRPFAEQVGTDGSSTFRMENGYLVDDVWVSGEVATIPIIIDVEFPGYPLVLTLHHAKMAGRMAADRRSMTDGIIAGILYPEELVASVRLAASSGPTDCDISLEGLANEFRAASDILDDGTQDPTRVCNGISVGFGFVSSPASLGDPTQSLSQITPCTGP
jgi:hypothetical protein